MRFHLKGTTSISQATYNLNYNVDHAGFVKNIYSELSSSTLFVVKQNLNTSAIYLSANMDRMYKANIKNNKKKRNSYATCKTPSTINTTAKSLATGNQQFI